MAQALRVNSSFGTLNFSMTEIDDEGAASIADALRANTTLTFIITITQPDWTNRNIPDKLSIGNQSENRFEKKVLSPVPEY